MIPYVYVYVHVYMWMWMCRECMKFSITDSIELCLSDASEKGQVAQQQSSST